MHVTRIGLSFVMLFAASFVIGCGGGEGGGDSAANEAAAPATLRCHVGGTMRPVMERLAAVYTERIGRPIEINSVGSGVLLAQIEARKEGDVYICHDPFIDILMDKKLGVDGWIIGELTPVIIVQKGNPKNITGLRDLTRPDVDLALTDYEHSTLGRMLSTIFSKVDIDLDELTQSKKITINRSGGYVANLVKMKNADAAMVWRAVAALRTDAVDIVPIVPEHLPTPGVDTVTSATGKDYALTPVRVTIATLACAAQPDAARDFAEFVASPGAAKVLEEFGFTVSGNRKLYEAGQPIE